MKSTLIDGISQLSLHEHKELGVRATVQTH